MQHPFRRGANMAQQLAIRRRFIQLQWHDEWMFAQPKEEDPLVLGAETNMMW